MFLQEVDAEIAKEALTAIQSATIVAKNLKATRFVFSKFIQAKPKVADLSEALCRIAGGRSVETLSNWTWGCRFCPIACEEWMYESFTEAQEFHLAYYMEMAVDAIKKMELGNIRIKAV